MEENNPSSEIPSQGYQLSLCATIGLKFQCMQLVGVGVCLLGGGDEHMEEPNMQHVILGEGSQFFFHAANQCCSHESTSCRGLFVCLEAAISKWRSPTCRPPSLVKARIYTKSCTHMRPNAALSYAARTSFELQWHACYSVAWRF